MNGQRFFMVMLGITLATGIGLTASSMMQHREPLITPSAEQPESVRLLFGQTIPIRSARQAVAIRAIEGTGAGMLLGLAIAGLDHAGLILRRIIRGNGTSKGNSTGSNHG